MTKPKHIVNLVGGIFDGSFTPAYEDDIPTVTCVISYETKVIHYYQLQIANVVDKHDRPHLKIWYQFLISKEFTKENDLYLQDNSNDYRDFKNTITEE